MVIKFSKKKHGSLQLTDNFKVSEFACKDGTDLILIDTHLVEILQSIRNHFNKQVRINSAYRTPMHDITVGGTGYGKHTKGLAVDIHIDGVTPIAIGVYATELLGNTGGIEIGNTYCHIDVADRKWRAFADESTGTYVTVSDFGTYLTKK